MTSATSPRWPIRIGAGDCAYTFVQGATAECIAQHPDPAGAGWLSVAVRLIAKPDRRPEEAWGESPIELLGDPVSPTDPNDPIGCAPDIPVAALDPLEPPGLSPTPQRVYDEVILQSGCCECTTGQDCRDDNLCTSQHICHCTCEYRYHCPTTSSPCGSQSCDPNIGCVTVPVNCDDDNPCTHDSCDPGFGCVHTPVCPDPSDACTTRWCDAPAGGVCRADPVDCDDDNPCTTDWCELPAGCRNESLRDPCTNGEFYCGGSRYHSVPTR